MGTETHYADTHIGTYITRITYHKKDRFEFFATLTPAERMAVFNDLSASVQQDFLDRSPLPLITQLLDHFDPQRAEQYIRRITDTRRRNDITKRLRQELKDKVAQFTAFHPKAAYELVHVNYILLPHTKTIGDAADAVDAHFLETGKIPEVLVRKDGVCIGEVRPGTLIREHNGDSIAHHVMPVPTVTHHATAADVARICMDSGEQKLIVIDAADGSVVGIVYTSDVLALFNERPLESLYNFANLQENEHPFDSVAHKVSARGRWMLVNLATVFISGAVIALFHNTLATLTILAMYIPVVIGMGSNAGTQALAVFIRGIALGEVSFANAWPGIRNEALAVVTHGMLHAAIITGIAIALGHGILVGITVGLAVMCALLIGVIAGCLIPLIAQKFGKDPALSSGIILTTFTDVFGLLSLLGFATVFLL